MTKKTKILAFAGSLREKSFNKRILRIANKGAEKAGAEVTLIDLRDYPMPIFDSDDLETNGFDENALRFQKLLTEHDGFLIASPEYNGSFPAALKNAIDWASVASGKYERADIFRGKFAAVMTAAPGSFGGVRVLSHLRGVLTSVGAFVMPAEIAVTFVEKKFAGDSPEMIDEKTAAALEALASDLVGMLKKMRRAPRSPSN